MSFSGLAAVFGVSLSLLVGCGANPTPAPDAPTPRAEAPKPPPEDPDTVSPHVSLSVLPSYAAGAPILIGLTVRNDDRDVLYGGLPTFDWLEPPTRAAWTLRDGQGKETLLSEGWVNEESDGGQTLESGAALSMLVDLSTLAPDLDPGIYQVRAGYPVDDFVASEWATLTIEAPAPNEAAALRAVAFVAGRTPEQGWGGFLAGAPKGVMESVTPLPKAIRAQVGLHVFVQRALYGKDRLEKLGLKELDFIDGGPLDGEREVLRYELLRAREDAAANDLRETILAQWPGLRWRVDGVDGVDGGYGFLEVQRELAERRKAYKARTPASEK